MLQIDVLDFLIKGGKRNRLVIHQELQIALKEYLRAAVHENNREAPLILATKPKSGRNPLNPLTRQQTNNIFMKYAREAGLPKGVRPHTARATFITQAIERRCPTRKHRESASFAVVY